MKTVALLAFIALGLVPSARRSEPAFAVGVDMNYALEMERAGKTWRVDGTPADIFVAAARAGATTFRVRLWMGDEGANGLHDATETARRALAAGMKPYVVLFLSDQWADFIKQPRPAAWKDLAEDALPAAVEAYTERVARHFARAGIPVDTYEIGNEIDFGIAGVFEESWPKRVSLEYMSTRVWPRMAPLLASAQRGVMKVHPNARFMLHLTQWENAGFCLAFWQTMLARGVKLDFAGLSYFPSASKKPENRTVDFIIQQVTHLSQQLNVPVILCETGFPSRADFGGQFSDWNQPVPGHAFSDDGQRAWISTLLNRLEASGHVAAVYYWSPEWAGSDIWGAFALFDAQGNARKGLKALGLPPRPTGPPAARSGPAASPPPTVQAAAWDGPPIFFGNLHSHTSLSDGQGTPEEAFVYARDVAHLDFLAVTEHNHLLGGDDVDLEERESLYAGPSADALVPAAKRHTRDGRFIAIHGQEFSSISKGNHINVFDVDNVIPVPNGEYGALLGWLQKHRDSTGAIPVVQFNHPALGSPLPPFPQWRARDYGRDDFGDDAGWVRQMGAVTHLMEVLNGEPAPESTERRAPQVMDDLYLRFLQLGFRVAPTGNQDNHRTGWGTATDVRTAIMAPALTKADLLAAMRARHVYATEDRNLRLVVRVGRHDCGDVVKAAGPLRDLAVELRILDSDEPDATYVVEAMQGRVRGPLAAPTQRFRVQGSTAGAVTVGNVTLEAPGDFVFFSITQRSTHGTDRAWTAPVWLEPPGQGTAGSPPR